jgi:hypothetical protein
MSEPKPKSMPGVSVVYAGSGQSITSNAMGMRAMQQRVWQFRGEQYLLLKSPPASGKPSPNSGKRVRNTSRIQPGLKRLTPML